MVSPRSRIRAGSSTRVGIKRIRPDSTNASHAQKKECRQVYFLAGNSHAPQSSVASDLLLPTHGAADWAEGSCAGNNDDDYLRRQLDIPPDIPVDLLCIEEPTDGERPPQHLTTLLKLAIYGSKEKMLTVRDIYQALVDRFAWFKNNECDAKWKDAVRMTLSLYLQFVRVQRTTRDGSKGYWTLDLSRGEGRKDRTRKGQK
ncbi:hypothetical protein DFH09DRAFT_913535 [Mycena vulgaris]|nr:hypothetical protein DFH09DRAFT_913535 [Mycena vulgaris]